MTKKAMEECRAYVASVFLSATQGREPMCMKDAYDTLDEWKDEGIEIPKGLTAYHLCNLWNEFCEGEEK